MKVTVSRNVWALAGLSLFPALLLAGTPDPAANLSACKNGWPSCDRSRLTLSGVTEVAIAKHARKLRLTGSEAREVALTDRQAYTLAAAERARSHSARE
jgi:hypothetical protein